MAGTLATRKPRSLLSAWRNEPFAAFPMLREEMGDLLSRFWGNGEEEWFGGTLTPSVDVSETDGTVEVRMDLPGVKANEIDIQINNNVLTISGERKEEKEEKGRTFHRVERRIGSFSRSLALPAAVAEDKVNAEYHEGVLKVTLPKTEQSKAQKIKVKG